MDAPRRTRITLQDERQGPNSFHLEARWVDGTGLLIEGYDSGPITAVMNDRGDYEWRYVIPVESMPLRLERLGAGPDDDIIGVLEGFTGRDSHQFVELAKDLRTDFWSW